MSFQTYAIVLPAIFFAGLVDSIAGGGGLLSVPAYLAAGLPPHQALGTNKFSSAFGTFFAALRYFRNDLMDLPVALLSAAVALGGSFAGTSAVLLVDPGFLRYLLIVLIPAITVFTILNRSMGHVDLSHQHSRTKKCSLAALAALAIGFYDGFFGPGTGSFLILVYTAVLRYDFVTANANTKVVNLASNVAALVTFISSGKVLYPLGIPAAAAGIAGNLIGAHMVLSGGARVIRPVFLAVLALLFAKIVWDLVA